MPSKNSLASIKAKAPSLPATEKNLQKKTDTGIIEKKKLGRKVKNKDEKETERVLLYLTPSQKNTLDEKRGLIPAATYVKHLLQTNTSLFKSN